VLNYILHGSVATYISYGGKRDKSFIVTANFMLNLAVKNIENRPTIMSKLYLRLE